MSQKNVQAQPGWLNEAFDSMVHTVQGAKLAPTNCVMLKPQHAPLPIDIQKHLVTQGEPGMTHEEIRR